MRQSAVLIRTDATKQLMARNQPSELSRPSSHSFSSFLDISIEGRKALDSIRRRKRMLLRT